MIAFNSITTGLLGICESRKLMWNYFRLSWYSVSSCSYSNATNGSPETSWLMRIFNAVILLMVSSLVGYLVSYSSAFGLQSRELQSRLLPGHGWARGSRVAGMPLVRTVTRLASYSRLSLSHDREPSITMFLKTLCASPVVVACKRMYNLRVMFSVSGHLSSRLTRSSLVLMV